MTSSLKNKAVSATIWSTIDTFGRQGLQFVITLILARLLTPADYGTVGLLAIFIGVAGVFIESGFSSALIQRREVSDVDISSVFYFNAAIALVTSIGLCLVSPWIAAFYKMPVLKPLTWLLAADLFIGAFGSIQRTLLMKALDFKKQFVISFAALCISGIIAVILAWRGYGVWSLGIQALSSTVISTVLFWFLSTWRPRLVFSTQAIRLLFRFGSFILFSELLSVLYNRLNTLVIGKFYSARDLGFYSRADGTQRLPAGLFSGIIARVAFPVFSSANEDKTLLRAGLKKAVTMVMMINIPIMVGIEITARSLILVLFGQQWLPSVIYLRILCLYGIFVPLNVLNFTVLLAQGHSRLIFRLEVVKKIVGAALVGTACFISITAIAWTTVATGAIFFCLNAFYSGKFLNYGILRQTADIMPYIAGSLAMAVGVWAVTLLPVHTPFLLLSGQVLVGAFMYIVLCYSLGFSAFIEAIQLAASRLSVLNSIGLK
jgi:O-antigen/teichoic acid export membrane protein